MTIQTFTLPALPLEILIKIFYLFSIPELFLLRQISRRFQTCIDLHLKLYFKSGPQITVWRSAFDKNGSSYGIYSSFELCSENSDGSNFIYSARWDWDQDEDIFVLLPFFRLEYKMYFANDYRPFVLYEHWLTSRLTRMYSKLPDLVEPHQQWIDFGNEICVAEVESDEGSCKSCVRYGGSQQRVFGWSFGDNLEEDDPSDLIKIRREPADISIWFIDSPDDALKIQEMLRNQGVTVFEGLVEGMQISLEDLSAIFLPKNVALQNWFKRVVLGKKQI